MKNKEAIIILQGQIDKLTSNTNNRNESWTIETRTYIKKFFGVGSQQDNYFDYFSWIIYPSIGNSVQVSPEQREKNTIEFLKNCISTIKNIGIYREPKNNFLSSLSDTIIVAIIAAIGTCCFLIGKLTSDTQNYKLEDKLNKQEITIKQLNKKLNDTKNHHSNNDAKNTNFKKE